ncbi:MAG: methylamine dehydrogenase (amicyanin) light chain [Cellvibrionaceae bacterium]|nr:methylamine dehydrogenase (amicyanin) light chain [Cellvibrionaceae bacterium]MCV6626435.1 methylamine dehydrogenase (amicyanin) light chain [Cellvibrionaceae bacterium]
MLNDWLDKFTEGAIRTQARFTSRRSFLRAFGAVLIGASSYPLLPVFRQGAFAQAANNIPETGDPNDCNYWRHCAIDGYLCGCCGGSTTSCPPGTVVSDITWIGTCRNPEDGRDYVISYNDCCGKSGCGNCLCQRDEGDTPIYRPQNTNNLNWCAGSQADIPYHCSLSVVIGVKAQ